MAEKLEEGHEESGAHVKWGACRTNVTCVVLQIFLLDVLRVSVRIFLKDSPDLVA